jgi:hypothetical protein
VLVTALAVQKCAFRPVVKNSAPTVRTPLKDFGFGMLAGFLTVAGWRVPMEIAVAAVMRALVQYPRACACAEVLTACVTAGAGVVAGVVAAPGLPAETFVIESVAADAGPATVATPANVSTKGSRNDRRVRYTAIPANIRENHEKAL